MLATDESQTLQRTMLRVQLTMRVAKLRTR
jgi:hypothetical protein